MLSTPRKLTVVPVESTLSKVTINPNTGRVELKIGRCEHWDDVRLLVQLAYQIKRFTGFPPFTLRGRAKPFDTNGGGYRVDMQTERKDSNFKFVENW